MRAPLRLARLLAAVGSAAAPLAAQDVPLAITNARVVTVSGPVIERGTVVVAKGRIAAVGAGVEVPPGATVIDGSGKTLYPGLFDALTSVGLVEVASVAATVDRTEVGDVNPHAKAWVALHPDSELIPVARANGLTTVLAAPSGGLVSGQSAVVRLAGTTPEAMTLKAPAALHLVYPSGRPVLDTMFAAPRTAAEQSLAQIWAEVLYLDQVGIHDNFFDLGGHSLSASRVISRAIKTFQIDLPLSAVFDSPTVAEMATIITGSQANQASEAELAEMLREVEAMTDADAQRVMDNIDSTIAKK